MSAVSPSATTSGRMPDFIIIGAMKCATSTLHEQLARQSGMFMSTPKEPNFFSNDDEWARGLDWYRGLFAGAKNGDLCGESSTHYTKLPTYPQTIARMKKHLPRDIKLIYVMRHPIDRLVSQYIHEWTQRVVKGSIDQAIQSNPEVIAYSRYAMQLRPYFDAFERDRILPLFFERLTSDAQGTLERACRFVGYQQQPRWLQEAGARNVSRQRLRKNALRDTLVGMPGLRALRRGIIPQSWRDRIKSLWTMKERPQLSESNLARLRDIFDEDLATLGQWLGIADLRCENFKEIARTAQPAWVAKARVPAA